MEMNFLNTIMLPWFSKDNIGIRINGSISENLNNIKAEIPTGTSAYFVKWT